MPHSPPRCPQHECVGIDNAQGVLLGPVLARSRPPDHLIHHARSDPARRCLTSTSKASSKPPPKRPSLRTRRKYKVFHPSRDARLGTPAWGVSSGIKPP